MMNMNTKQQLRSSWSAKSEDISKHTSQTYIQSRHTLIPVHNFNDNIIEISASKKKQR